MVYYFSLSLPYRGQGGHRGRLFPSLDSKIMFTFRSLLREQAYHYLHEIWKPTPWLDWLVWMCEWPPSWESIWTSHWPWNGDDLWETCLAVFVVASRELFWPDIGLSGFCGKLSINSGFLHWLCPGRGCGGGRSGNLCVFHLQRGAPTSLCLVKRREKVEKNLTWYWKCCMLKWKVKFTTSWLNLNCRS